MNRLPTGTVTFLFTDIEGSTRLLERLRGRYADVLSDQRNLLRKAFSRWNGHEIDTQGDAFFVAFSRAADALRCAIDGQRALSAWAWPEQVEVRVRMGIHSGEPILTDTGYVGMEVHRAARIAAGGHGGQILLSGTARDLVSEDLPDGVQLRDLGLHRLKDLRGRTRLFQVTAPGLRDDFAPLITAAASEPPPTPGEPPYLGLQAFDESDAERFFGREEWVARLVERVRAARFTAVIGASGSGKSSLLRAGLIPALRAEGWRVVLLTPTAHPLESLAAAVAPDATSAQLITLIDDLAADRRGLALTMRPRSARRAAPTLIAVDQLEEAFTLCRDPAEREAFIANLAAACGLEQGPADSPPPADRSAVMVTLRADFYAFLAGDPVMREAIAASQLYLGAMSADELRRAIVEPARRGDWEFVPGLVDLLLADVGNEPGALPLLSHALMETWRRRRGTTMTLRSYAESGGVKGAIGRTADRAYAELSEPQRAIARDIFLRLTELGEATQDTRRRATLSELLPADDEQASAVREVIGSLASARLITVGEDSVEVAHEALIREWPTLREWLRADREGLRLHRRLTEAAREWERTGFDVTLLYRGIRLAQVSEWLAANPRAVNELERRFVNASGELARREEAEREAARQRELSAAQAIAAAETRRAEEAARSAARLRRRAILLAAATGVAAALAGVAVILAGDSNRNAALAEERATEARQNAALAEERAAEAESQRLGALANSILLRGGDPALASMLALTGLRASYSTDADSALQRALRADTGWAYLHDAPVDDVAITPDGQTLITASGGDVRMWDVASRGQASSLPGPSLRDEYSEDSHLQLSDDGRLLLVAVRSGGGMLYRLPEAQPEPGCPSLSTVGHRALSADGRTLATLIPPAFPGVGDIVLSNGGIVVEPVADCRPRRVLGPAAQRAVALSPDGSRIGTVGDRGADIRIWDASGGSPFTFAQNIATFEDLRFSPDGRWILVGATDGTARQFDAATGELRQTFSGHADVVYSARLSPDGSRLLTASRDGTARVWDVQTGQELRRFTHPAPVTNAVFAPDGHTVYTACQDGAAREWSIESAGETSDFAVAGSAAAIAFSPEGGLIAIAGAQRFGVWSVAERKQLMDVEQVSTERLAFSPDGTLLLAASPGGGSAWPTPTQPDENGGPMWFYGIRDVQSGFAGLAVGFPPDSSFVLAGGHPADVFEPRLATRDSASGEAIRFFTGATGVLSPDGGTVATWRDGHVLIIDAQTGSVLSTMSVPRRTSAPRRTGGIIGPQDLLFTPDGTKLVTGDADRVVRIRDVQSGEVLTELRGPTSAISRVAVTPDGTSVLAASHDGMARMWDLASGRLQRVFPGHVNLPIVGLAVSPDGRTLALGSSGGAVVLTPLSLSDLEAEACARLHRDLTEDERVAYDVTGAASVCN